MLIQELEWILYACLHVSRYFFRRILLSYLFVDWGLLTTDGERYLEKEWKFKINCNYIYGGLMV